jgi:serine/threonine protein kinase
MSEVYLGYDRRLRRKVAVKVLYGSSEPFVRRFEREALAVGTLSHDHILSLYDFGEQRPWYYLVMPYVEGGTLRDYLQQRQQLSLEEAASFLYQIASALQYAHDHGVIHRDVKPSNILLRLDGHAYLVDFGLAKAKIEAETLTHAGAMIGTPEYMAPEQSNGEHDYRSDIYSLGVVLYQMLTGRVPFSAESPVAVSLKHIQLPPTPPRQLNPSIPQAIEDVILKVLEKDPNERYQEARILAAAYKKALHQGTSWTDEQDEQPTEADQPIDLSPVFHAEHSPADTHILAAVELEQKEDKLLLFPLHKAEQVAGTFPSLPTTTKRVRRRHRPFFYITCIALLCVLIASSLSFITHAQTPSLPSRGHVQHRQMATSIPTTIPTPSPTSGTQVNIQATLAAQAQAQATAGITGSLGAGNVLYSNSMTLPDNAYGTGGWLNDGSQCFFSSSGYHVAMNRPHAVAWCYSGQQVYSDVIITAQAQLLRGDVYGVIFRLQSGTAAFYALEINSEGAYRLVRAQGSDPQNWLVLIDWTPSAAIAAGYGQTNVFLIMTTGSQFRFYINRQLLVDTFVDTTYTTGLLGFLAGGDSESGTEAVFDDVWVFQK